MNPARRPESDGIIGYLLDQALVNRLARSRQVATLLTQLIVDPGDPAFARPEKFIGPVDGDADAHRLSAERGWTMPADGRFWRRVVPSPEPRAIVELGTIKLLVDAGLLVVLRELPFAPGSMGPKVNAACCFAERTGGLAGIGALADAAAILRGERGTRVHAQPARR